MNSLNITIKQPKNQTKKILVEMDAGKFEKLAAALGFFSNDFLTSLDQAEKDYKIGRVRKIKSLEQVRK